MWEINKWLVFGFLFSILFLILFFIEKYVWYTLKNRFSDRWRSRSWHAVPVYQLSTHALTHVCLSRLWTAFYLHQYFAFSFINSIFQYYCVILILNFLIRSELCYSSWFHFSVFLVSYTNSFWFSLFVNIVLILKIKILIRFNLFLHI